jgi:hypothetical protein
LLRSFFFASSAISWGALFPWIRARNMMRPEVPKTSVATLASPLSAQAGRSSSRRAQWLLKLQFARCERFPGSGTGAAGDPVGKLSSEKRLVSLSMSVKTAQTHRSNIMRKLDIHLISELVLYAARNNIIQVLPIDNELASTEEEKT